MEGPVISLHLNEAELEIVGALLGQAIDKESDFMKLSSFYTLRSKVEDRIAFVANEREK